MANRLTALRLAFAAADRLSPGRAARVAGNSWFTPPRSRRAAPNEPPDGKAFAVQLGEATIRGTFWGDSGLCVYFMHGWGGRGADVAPMVPLLLERGFRVVTFDGPAHGRSDPLTSGTRRTNASEMGRALAAVVAQHGPTYAVIAHSLGTVALALALRSGDLGCERVVLLAPVVDVRGQLAAFCRHLGIGRRTMSRLDGEVRRHTGLALDAFTVLGPDDQVGVRDVLAVHDRDDLLAAYDATADHVRDWPVATLVGTEGLGHYRLLKDRAVAGTVADHLAMRRELSRAAGRPGSR